MQGTAAAPAKSEGKTFNPVLILMAVVIVCAVASWFVTPGAFERQVVNGRTVVVPGSYHEVAANPIGFFRMFLSIPEGMIGASSIIWLILLVAGTVKVYTESGALDKGISRLLMLSERIGSQTTLCVIMILFALIGGFLGWSEQIIPFAPIITAICLSLRYDALVGMACGWFVCMIGFSVSPTNMFTVAICHQIAELPMFSGIELRLVILTVMEVITIAYILHYAAKVKKDPTKSVVYGIDDSDLRRDYSAAASEKMSIAQITALVVFGLTFVVAIYCVLNRGWGMNEMSAAFVISGVLAGIICRMPLEKIVTSFVEGSKTAFYGAMIIGISRAIQILLEDGRMIDPIVNSLSQLLIGLPSWLTAVGVFIVVTLLNAVVPSGSGKAIAIMPIMVPLADMIGVNRQVATLAYQFGDGISNTLWFTNSSLLIFLAMAKIPLSRWYRFVIPLQVVLFAVAIGFLIFATKIGYGPF